MAQPQGQIRTELPPIEQGGPAVTAISSAREVEQGARSMLLLAEGLFRLDVVPDEDTIQTIVRNLSPAPRIELRLGEVGGAAIGDEGSSVETLSPTGRFGGEVVQVDERGEEQIVARLLVGSVLHPDRGLTAFTAQATLT